MDLEKGPVSGKDDKKVEKLEKGNEPAASGTVEDSKNGEKKEGDTAGTSKAGTSGSGKKIVKKVRKVKVTDKKTAAENASTKQEKLDEKKQEKLDEKDSGENAKPEAGDQQVSECNTQNEDKSIETREKSEATETICSDNKNPSSTGAKNTPGKKTSVRKVIRKVTKRVPKKTTVAGEKTNNGAPGAEKEGEKNGKETGPGGNQSGEIGAQKVEIEQEAGAVSKASNEAKTDDGKSLADAKIQTGVEKEQDSIKGKHDSKPEKIKEGEKLKDDKEKKDESKTNAAKEEKEKSNKERKDESRSKSNKEQKDKKKIEEPPRPGFILQTKGNKESKVS